MCLLNKIMILQGVKPTIQPRAQWGSPKGGLQPADAIFQPGQLKNQSFLIFFDMVTTQNGHPRYVKHVLGSIYVFSTPFGYWVPGGGSPKGLVHNLLMQFFTLGSSKIKVSETYILIS